MKNLFAQIMKFGVVGVICFGIDYVIGLSVMKMIVKLGANRFLNLHPWQVQRWDLQFP